MGALLAAHAMFIDESIDVRLTNEYDILKASHTRKRLLLQLHLICEETVLF